MWAQAIPLMSLLVAVFAAGGAWVLLRIVYRSNEKLGGRVGRLERFRTRHMEFHRTERNVRRELTGRHVAIPELVDGDDDGEDNGDD